MLNMRAVEPRNVQNEYQKSPTPRGRASRRVNMVKNFEDMQKLGKDNMDATLKSFEDGSKALEKLFGAKTLEKAIEIQTDYAKQTYEAFVAEATKLGELYLDFAKESYKPLESYIVKATPAK